jgi:dipeptidyl aminopeptidase/acylaminoacyl peptidase
MPERTVAPFGSWRSPFPIELLVAGRVGLVESRFDVDGQSLVWLESRPEEDGRQVLVRWTPGAKGDGRTGGTARDISPSGMNVRDRVHEYGGASYLAAGDLVLVSDFATGLVHRVAADRSSEPITPEGPFRYADYELDEQRGRIVAVREDHSGSGEAVNTLVAIPLDGSGKVDVLAEGRTFYSFPRLSPDGNRLAFLAWDHPNLPWDGTELFVAPVTGDGAVGAPERVVGSATDWVAQPAWSPSGVLHFVAEPDGWMNLYRFADGRVEPVTRLEAEFAFPDWVFGLRNYAFAADGTIYAVGRSDGADRLYRIPPGGAPRPLDLPFTEMGDVDVAGDRVSLMGAGPRSFNAIVVVDPRDASYETIRVSSTAEVEPDAIAVPEPIEYPTTGGRTAHGLFYRPTNTAFEGPPGERPPLIVTSHGGPTAQAFGGLAIPIQLFTSRGFAVLDVDYGGSTGYGKEYRKRLEGEWGVVDVDDCVNGARWLADRGDVDGERLSIRGGSASGYTTLSTLAFRDVFAAGVSYFGIGDLLAFAKETHKFESRYLDRLLGPLPEATEIYRQRSPNNFADQITAAVLILQGLEDRVVPPTEAERIVDALWERRIPHAYIPFEGEDHGFRKAESLTRSFEAELSFLAQVFGFEPADEIEPIEVVNLDAARRGARAGG